MLQNMQPVQSLPRQIQTAIDILVLSSQRRCLQPNGIMTRATENYWQLSELLKNGDIISRDHLIQRPSIPTMQILVISNCHRHSAPVKHDGHYMSLSSI